jgi:hypothetical protein
MCGEIRDVDLDSLETLQHKPGVVVPQPLDETPVVSRSFIVVQHREAALFGVELINNARHSIGEAAIPGDRELVQDNVDAAEFLPEVSEVRRADVAVVDVENRMFAIAHRERRVHEGAVVAQGIDSAAEIDPFVVGGSSWVLGNPRALSAFGILLE